MLSVFLDQKRLVKVLVDWGCCKPAWRSRGSLLEFQVWWLDDDVTALEDEVVFGNESSFFNNFQVVVDGFLVLLFKGLALRRALILGGLVSKYLLMGGRW